MSTLLLLASLLVPPPSIDFIRANALPLSQPDQLPIAVATTVAKYHVISVGEIHGSEEAPRFVLGLLRRLRSSGKTVLLGLEMPADEQPAIDKYLASGDLAVLRESPFFRRDFQDGRSSRAMARLLGEVRALAGVRVYGFDATDVIGDQDRDEKMASNLAAAMKKTPTDVVVFLAGNIHAAAGVGSPFDPKFRPMGYQLHLNPETDLFEGYRATFFARKLAPSLPLGG